MYFHVVKTIIIKLLLRNKSGKLLYSENCARCHGASGEGGSAIGGRKPIAFRKKSIQGSLSNEDISDAVFNGRPMMPPFIAVLSKKDVQSLISYLRHIDKEVIMRKE